MTTQTQDARIARMEQINQSLASNPRFIKMLESLVWMLEDFTVEFPYCGVFMAKWLMEFGRAGLEERIENGMVERFVDDTGEVNYRILEIPFQRHANVDYASLHPGLQPWLMDPDEW